MIKLLEAVTTIGGKEKSIPICPVCKGGEIFKDETFTYTDELSPRTRQRICGVCGTKYVFRARLQPDKEVSKNNAFEVSRLLLKDLERDEVDSLVESNRLAELKEQYVKTGVCNHDIIVETNPFKTHEGTFKLKTCLVCRKAIVNYHGEEIIDTINNVVNFLVKKGFEYYRSKPKKDTMRMVFSGPEKIESFKKPLVFFGVERN